MAKIQFIYTEEGFKKTGSDTNSPPSASPNLQQVLDAGDTAEEKEIHLTHPDEWQPDMELTHSSLTFVRQGDGNSSMQDVGGFQVQNAVDGFYSRLSWNSIEFINSEETAQTNLMFDPTGMEEDAHTLILRHKSGYVATEEYVNQENSVVLSIARVRRYAKSSGFTSSNSTTPIVMDSIPLGDPADLENKRLHLLSIIEKVGGNGALTVTAYLHNAAITIGGAPAGTQIGTYTSPANQNDFPFERARMFVVGGQLFPARPASGMLNDMVAAGAVLSGVTVPSNAHIIISGSLANASDTFQPKYITLEY